MIKRLKSLFGGYGKYSDSKNASTYEKIAKSLNCTPQHVYEVAHGKRRITSIDADIWHELRLEGIIHRQRK